MTVVDILFKDTIAARMLRLLAERGSMPQAEFMVEYHRRCERPDPTKAKSGFKCNFGRYLSGPLAAIKRSDIRPSDRARDGARRQLLHWNAWTIDDMLRVLTDKQLTDAYASLEALLQDHPPGIRRATDDVEEISRWVVRLKGETVRRTQPKPAIGVTVRSLIDAARSAA